MTTIHELKERIRSVQSSQKITGAMRMIATSRLRKAEQDLLQARACRQQLLEVHLRLRLSGLLPGSPWLEERRAERVALVVFAAEEGMCGAFNINVGKKWREIVDDFHTRGISDVEVFPVGKKILAELSRTKGAHPSELPVPWDAADVYASSRRLADALMEDFRVGRYDRVEVLYTSYKSMGSQTVRLRCLLPFMPDPETSGLPGSGNDPSSEPVSLPHPEAAPGRPADYILEPGAEEVAATLYPMSIRAALFEMCLSGKASEEASRILAMQAANDNARELIDTLQLEYNKLRQQSITEELSDIFSLPL